MKVDPILENYVFFEWINACLYLFPNSWKCPGYGLKKKTIENKDEYVSESVFDFGTWHEATAGETQDPLTRTSQSLKKARANKERHEHLRLHKSIRGEASVSIYILALALSRVLSVRVYRRH